MKKRLILIAGALLLVLIIFALTIIIKKGTCVLNSAGGQGSSLTALVRQAKELEAENKLSEAKIAYQKLVSDFSNSPEVANWQKKTEEINIKLLFSPQLTLGSVLYQIRPGDTLTKIAKEFGTTVELIKKSNNLENDTIIPGRKIKVCKAPFSMLVDKSQNTLMLKTAEEIVKTYIVSTGKNNSTPAGNFKITTKIVNPTWFKAGAVIVPDSPENVLGTRWLGFDLVGYGIHGTTEPQTLGKQVTQGCVRMSNADVEELYTIVPQGSEVSIVD